MEQNRIKIYVCETISALTFFDQPPDLLQRLKSVEIVMIVKQP